MFRVLPSVLLLRWLPGVFLGVVWTFFNPTQLLVQAEEPLSFNRDIRPILSEHCWKCHGFDAQRRESGLRLDDREAAVSTVASGAVAIVPGHPEQSELITRLMTDDPDLRMPPPSTGKQLTPIQIETLKRWIAAGAPYQRHWSFEPIVHSPVPHADVVHPIDAFVASRLAKQGLTLAPAAERDTLIRRVYFDLIGLPPSWEELQRARQSSWETSVDELLASPHFGERMAVDWLDTARYADTDGYFGDKPRQMWLWRDWVINAFNRNLPFDQFTLEQLAGDLLPHPTIEQRIATGFNRNHMSNNESGLIDEEYRVEYVVDRVDTTMSTWLGLTIGCAQCHDHKYDPISQKEYYQLFAFFNNVPEKGLLIGQNAPPRISVPSPLQEQQLTQRTAATAEATRLFEPLRAAAVLDLQAREQEIMASLPPLPGETEAIHLSLDGAADRTSRPMGTSLKPTPGIRADGLKFDATQHLERDVAEFPVDGPWTLGLWLAPEKSLGCPVSKIEPHGNRCGMEVVWRKGRVLVNLIHRWGESGIEIISRDRLPGGWQHLAVRYDGSGLAKGVRLFFNGQPAEVEILRDSLKGTLANSEPLRIARRDEGLGFYGAIDEIHWIPEAIADADIQTWVRAERLRGVLERSADKRAGTDRDWLLDHYVDSSSEATTRSARDALRVARTAEQRLRETIPTALVMEDQTDVRPTHVLVRGVYNQPGEPVQPDTPLALSRWPGDAPRNRLGLAQWLVAADNPLTARVAVNRLWRQCFGEGLVRTAGDFGTQGEPPTHPELLDFLAAHYRDSGWDTKALLRLIVTSQTYRQSSHLTMVDGEIFDPENRLLARGPRFRLSQEMIRDQALATSSLLVRQLGGPSVKPYQPPGLWEEVSYDGEASYEVDEGPGRHRRSLYTFHKRQSPPPALMVFDGPTREKCTLIRPRTNTPLQALVLLNDETFVESARSLAAQLLAIPATDSERINRAVQTILSREPDEEETKRLEQFLVQTRQRYAAHTALAQELTGGQEAGPAVVDHAAWTILVHTLFNLDEAITRR